ncbi:MAG: RagB/SusD family nutrient uptake outer membrane protein [Candidatus Cryptobacteroides sp.]
MKLRNILLAALAILLYGCVSLEQYPTDSYTDKDYWTKEENIRAALYKAYSQCFGEGLYFKNNILSDDGYGSRHVSDETNISTGTANAYASRYQTEWNQCYKALRTVHTILDNEDRIDIGDEALKERFLAEARYVRAYSYLRLVTWFGDVPFFTTNPTLEESRTVSRTAASTVMDFVHAELAEIAEILPKNTELKAEERGRYTCGAAVALNARAYLLDNDFENCAKECAKLIETTDYGKYALASDYDKLFNKHRGYENEAIMTLEYAIGEDVNNILVGWTTVNVLPVSVGGPNVWFSPTQELVNCFLKLDGTVAADTDYEGRDKRFYATIAYNKCQMELPQHGKSKVTGSLGVGKGVYTCYTNPADENEAKKVDANLTDSYDGSESRTVTGYYNRKNYDPATIADGGKSYKAIMEIRYGDVLLMYAESMFETGNMSKTVWDKTIKPLRERAGFEESMLEYPSVTGEEMRNIIRNERRCELALEGRRVYDLRRWAVMEDPEVKTQGKAVLTSQAHGAPFLDNGQNIVCQNPYKLKYWFPIPQGERDINGNLVQNPGW